ncbi:MAG: alpha/beta hydrolase [Mariniblastus sp.]
MQRFFGHPESPLFGVYHAPRGTKLRPVRAAVICPPVGQEFIRTHWSLRLLANQLARKGVHVLRLDYHGIGDSAGSIEQIDALHIWENDIAQAVDHLKKESAAETTMLIGQRFGASLAARVAEERRDVNSLVLWEPVLNGKKYLDSLRAMHAEMYDLWMAKMKKPEYVFQEEILGSLYSSALLEEIESVQIDIESIRQPHLIVDTETDQAAYSHWEPSLQKVISEENEGSWDDLRVLETARLRPKTTRTIVKTVDNMFTRLKRFDALNLASTNFDHSNIDSNFIHSNLTNSNFTDPTGA